MNAVNDEVEIDLNEVNRIFLLQKQATIRFRVEPPADRIRRLRKLERWVLDNQAHIHDALLADLKKSNTETDISEILPVMIELREAISNLRKWSRPKRYSTPLTYVGTRTCVRYEPKGVCLIISPWNYPFNLTIGPFISAIAAGNTVIMKPSEFTPNTSSLIGKMIHELFEEDTATVFEGDAEVSTALLRLPFDHIFFTGSPSIGKVVMEAAAKNLTSVTLELGGKSPTIVDKTCNIRDAAKKIAWGKWLNAGQTCVAPDYLFAHQEILDPLMKEIDRYSTDFYGGENSYTSIVSARHFKRLEKLTEQLTPAQRLFGGTRDENSLRIDPTAFLVRKEENLALLHEEIFGPILPVMSFADPQEVVTFINARPKPLALYIFSRDRKLQEKILRETSSGTAVINDTVLQFAHPRAPFGGVNNSGIGKSHGYAGFLAFSNEKTVLEQRIGITMAQSLYPPYSPLKNRLVQFLLRHF